jgi:hypothetical protein
MTIFGGKPDQGKGLLVTKIAADVSNSRYPSRATGKMRAGKVLYSAWEDLAGVMTRPRIEAAGANMKNIELARFMLPSEFEDLALALAEEEYDLLVIDPLTAHLDSGVSRFNDSIRQVTNPLTQMLELTGTACVIIEHMLKHVPKHADPIQAIGGSGSGIVAAARMAFLFGTDPHDGDRRILAAIKHNISGSLREMEFEIDTVYNEDIDDEVPFLIGGAEVDFDVQKLMHREKGKMGRPADKRAQAAEWLTRYLFTQGPMAAHKIYEDAKQWGMNSKTLGAAAKEMGVEKNPPGGGRSCVWSLPAEIADLAKATFEEEAEEAEGRAPQGAEPPTDVVTITDEDLAQLLGGDGTDAKEGEDDGKEKP